MKLTKGVITREQALVISSDYVAFIEGDYDKFDAVDLAFQKLKRNQSVITYFDGLFIRAKVTSVNNNDFLAVDGPVVRVSNGEYSWRVDGDRFAFPIEGKKEHQKQKKQIADRKKADNRC